jgi:NADPH:quinone reductase-like Zn-dependent oxidoreductase
MSLPTRMRAVYVTAHGPAEAIQVGELPVPAAGPTDVLVAVQVVALDRVARSERQVRQVRTRARPPGARVSGGPG